MQVDSEEMKPTKSQELHKIDMCTNSTTSWVTQNGMKVTFKHKIIRRRCSKANRAQVITKTPQGAKNVKSSNHLCKQTPTPTKV
jgi:hypothetical protein